MKKHFIEERKKTTFIPELSLVAVFNDEIVVGKVALHETDIVTKNGRITQLTLSHSAFYIINNYYM